MKKALVLLMAAPALAQLPPGIDEAYFKGNPTKIMEEMASRAQAIKPKDSRLLAEYGRAYLAAGNRTKAEAAFTAAIANDPKDAETFRLIAFAWLRNSFKDEAWSAYEGMLKADYKAKNAIAKAAVNLMDYGMTAKADEMMERAFTLDPKDWQNAIEFAKACLRAKNSDLAAKWFAKTVQARPKEERMWNEIALSFADKGQNRDADR